jgi:hypothetical protein
MMVYIIFIKNINIKYLLYKMSTFYENFYIFIKSIDILKILIKCTQKLIEDYYRS